MMNDGIHSGSREDAPAFLSHGRMPVAFIGHGSPENALGNNPFSNTWKRLGEMIPKPALILSISAHWVTQEGIAVTAIEHPRTIHDFYGFPDELYRIEYPAPGSLEGAKLVQNLVRSSSIGLDYEWGLDHGTWSVLRHMYPDADIPVIQLSLNYNQPLSLLYRIGKELNLLRTRGVLILGSGNLVHNLMMLNMHAKPYPWAVEFDDIVKTNLETKDYDSLINYTKYHISSLAHPTSEHYLPLICVIGAAGGDRPQFFNETIFGGSVSMRSVVFGLDTKKQV
ncbi:MAG: 4,5-DOPA dioxygenase extradiol [Methanoregula sp.]|jgi:4,5-DOPA dioxygenase extradiol